MSWYDPRTWLGGEEPDANVLNQHIRDNFKALTEFTSYVPVLTSSGTAPSTSAATGGYIYAGKWVTGWFELVLSAAGSGNYSVNVPVAAAGHWFPKPFGQVSCINGSGGYFARQLINTGSATIASMTGDGGTRVSATSPFAFASGHTIAGTFAYEAA
jgi:hypothetical protein